MELSIIVASYRNPELLKLCLTSIKKNYTGSDYELIVTDGETKEATVTMMREDFPEVIFVSSRENIGFGGLVKNGYAKSSGQFILILNSDILIKKNSIETLLDYIKSDSGVGIVGPQLLGFDEKFQPSSFRFYTPLTIIYRRTFLGKFNFAKKHLARFLMQDFDHKSIKDVDWIMGSALMTTRAAIERVGLMDPKFKMYFEDTDWCRRFWENNYRVVYNPNAKIYHYHGKGSAGKSILRTLASNRLAWIHIASGIKYFLKYAGKKTPNVNN
jgi:hypothetical protein